MTPVFQDNCVHLRRGRAELNFPSQGSRDLPLPCFVFLSDSRGSRVSRITPVPFFA
jgi:hypothetical protein